MAMKVPTYETQVNTTAPQLKTPVVPGTATPSAVPDAFGGEIGKETERLGQAGQKIAGQLLQLAQDEQDKESEKRITAFHRDLQTRLSDPNTETINVNGVEVERPRGLLNRQFAQAKGITKDLDNSYYTQIRKQYLDGLSKYQFAKVAPALDNYYTSIRDNVISHEARQLDEDMKNTVKAGLEQRVLDATLINEPQALTFAIDDAVQSSAVFNKRFDSSTQKLMNEKVASDITKTAVISVVENTGDYTRAKEMLDTAKDKLAPAQYAEINAEISKRAVDVAIASDMSTTQEDSLVMQELQKGKKGIFYFLPETERVKAIKESQQRIYYNNQIQKKEVDKVRETRSDAIIDKFLNNTITLSDIDNEMTVPEQAGGINREELRSYQNAIKRGIDINLKEMLQEKTPQDKTEPTKRAKLVAEYLSLVNVMGDETDKWSAKEKLAKAFSDGVIDKQELAFLNSLKKNQSTFPSSLIISSMKNLQAFFTGHNALAENTALGLKQLIEMIQGKTDPIVATKTIQQRYIYQKVPEAVSLGENGGFFRDFNGTTFKITPEGTEPVSQYPEKKKDENRP